MREDVSLSELLDIAIKSKINDMHFCLPAVVQSYDRSKQKCSVQPALKRKYEDGSIVNLPIINNVPVVFPRAKDKFIHFDLEKGDYVTLVFSERSIDRWKAKGGVVQPDDVRRSHLSDAYAIPGGYPTIEGFTPNGAQGSIEVSNGSNKIEIKSSGEVEASNDSLTFILKPDGKVQISNASEELISLLSDVLQEIIGARVLTMLGLQPLTGLTQTFPVLKTKIDTFKV